jgi:hypothetical protein
MTGDERDERAIIDKELATIDDEREREIVIQAYSKIAEQVTKEDGLVNQRLTWGASINAALLALLGVVFTLLGAVFKESLPNASIYVTTILVCLIAIFLSIIAVLVCHWTIKGIVDARKQLRYIHHIYNARWERKICRLGLPRPFFDKDKVETFFKPEVKNELCPPPMDAWWGDKLFRWGDKLFRRGDKLFRLFGLDGKTLGMDHWWGDNLFRLMIGLWVFVIVVYVVIAISAMMRLAWTIGGAIIYFGL